MVIPLCYTSAFSEVIYVDFDPKILDLNFRLVDENSKVLVVVFVSKLNFSFSFRFVDENYRIFVVVVVFMTKYNLLSFYFLQCFDTVGWVIWPVKTVPDMTYNVFSGTLNPTQSIYPAGPIPWLHQQLPRLL